MSMSVHQLMFHTLDLLSRVCASSTIGKGIFSSPPSPSANSKQNDKSHFVDVFAGFD